MRTALAFAPNSETQQCFLNNFLGISIYIVLNHLIIIRHLFVIFIRVMKAEETEIMH